MPREVRIHGTSRSVATETELLNFANKVRKAGGADVLDALLPSKMSEPTQCLIARALNFHCYVTPWAPVDDRNKDEWSSGAGKWVMIPQRGNAADCEQLARELASALKLRLVRTISEDEDGQKGDTVYSLMLPEHIGNAASAFDAGAAFRNYVV